jgi:GNAT superfamily N-acetyltransferase
MNGRRSADAVEANLTAFHVMLSEWPEISLQRERDRIWTRSARRFSLCNVILDAQFDVDDTERQIELAVAPFQATDVNLMWKLGPSTRPANLGARLADRGFRIVPTLRGMALTLERVEPPSFPSPGFEVRDVGDLPTLELWRQAIERGFGWPPYGPVDVVDNLAYFFRRTAERAFVPYVGISGGEPVASSLVFFGAGVAGIYHVSTAPDHRGRGLGTAVTTAALIEARRRGYALAILHATRMGYPVYRRLGFEDVCDITMRLRLNAA